MNVHGGLKRLLAVASLATLVAAPARADDALAEGQLRWTPHRTSPAAQAAEDASATAEPAMPAPGVVDSAASGPPASVVLPDDVRLAPRSRPAAPANPVGREASRPTRGTNPAMNMLRGFDPSNPDGLFGDGMLRTPRGDASRPIMAAEGRQAVAMQRRALDRVAADLPNAGRRPATGAGVPARGRPDRLAMNVDGIPSVMTRAPQSAAVEAPRMPTNPQAAEPVPAPAGTGISRREIVEDGSAIESLDAGSGFGVEGLPIDAPVAGDEGLPMAAGGGLLLGDYPAELHVESFYDDPYACEDDECAPLCVHHGLFCNWLRRFGKPYYGWRWYRDFTASAGVTSFTNSTDLGINGNFGVDEYLNFAMPFWNAFGIGWQVGWRGTQTNFQEASIEAGDAIISKNARQQNFITTGFFTRAFEGRGLQGGAVYDYLNDNWFDNTDVSQLRAEISYVWGYHEVGFWSATNIGDQIGLFGPVTRVNGVASTLDLYCGFYRLQFGDANEWKVWGGGTHYGDGVVGTLVRAPMSRSFALEGTFTYVIPGDSQQIDIDGDGTKSSFSPAAWNVAVNLVYYPAGRSRRSLASPYRPLFDVADNGNMIRTINGILP